MLRIGRDTVPRTALAYFAFRVSFQSTLERILLARQWDVEDEEFGFLTEVPFLKSVPPQVQLDLLAATWARHISREPFVGSLMDESVIYAVCETAAAIVEHEPRQVPRFLDGGPVEFHVEPDRFLAAELRALHLSLSNEGDFLMISQFEDMDPEEAKRLKQSFALDGDRLAEMFAPLARWHVSPEFSERLAHLLSPREIARVSTLIPTRVVSRD